MSDWKRVGTPLCLAVLLLADATPLRAVEDCNTVDPAYRHAPPQAMERWHDLKYGVRIHWGPYCQLGKEASTPLMTMSNEDRQRYQQLYQTFNPTEFDAYKWMDLFERCGLKFFAFTTKHADGFSMFDTKTRVKRRINWIAAGGPKIEECDLAYSIMETPYRRDIVKQLTEAAHMRGIAFDLYFNHMDWYDADFRMNTWNPYKDPQYTKQSDPEGYARFVQRHHTQIREILTDYGSVDMLCLDMFLPEWCWPDVKPTVMMARSLQPAVLMRNRGIGAYGDYCTPEKWIPDSPTIRTDKGSLVDVNMPWMVIYPMADIFAYEPDGLKYKSAEWVLTNLIDIVAKGGNFQVGIGPDPQGNFHPLAVARLEEVGRWLKVNGEAIYGTRPWVHFQEGDQVRFTRSKDGRFIYAISLEWPGKMLNLRLVRPRQGSEIHLLGYPNPVPWHLDQSNGLVIELPDSLQQAANRPCRGAYAFQIEGAGTE